MQDKANKQKQVTPQGATTGAVSRSFIVSHGKVGSSVRQLVQDMRRVMSPYTAEKLQTRNNSFKDFQAVADLLHVTHLIAFTATDIATYMRTSRMPHGPTLTFRVHNYSLMKDIRRLYKRAPNLADQMHPALVVLSGFGGEENHIKLMKSMLQNLFPTISVANTKQQECKRVVLLKLNKDTQRVELRHYLISLSHVGLSKTVKRVVTNNLGSHLTRYSDVADFLMNGGTALSSGSEAEDPAGETHIQLADHNQSVAANSQMAVRLTEIGPRIQFELVKVEADFFAGEVLFHAYVRKTAREVQEQFKRLEQLKALKNLRRAEQEKNVEAKKQKNKPQPDESDDLDRLPAIDGEFDASDNEQAEEPDDTANIQPDFTNNDKQTNFTNPIIKFKSGKGKAHKKGNQKRSSTPNTEKGAKRRKQ